MANALSKITARAKQLRKKRPSMAWSAAIKQAGKEYRSTKSSKSKQTGSSNTVRDRRVKAKAPGKRKSTSGKVYYERRKNRSDVPGRMTGTKYTSQLAQNLSLKEMSQMRLQQLSQRSQRGMTAIEKARLALEKKQLRAEIEVYKKNISNIKKLIK